MRVKLEMSKPTVEFLKIILEEKIGKSSEVCDGLLTLIDIHQQLTENEYHYENS